MRNQVIFFSLFILIIGCKKSDSISSQVFVLDYFNSVEINNSFEIELIEGPEHKIEISSENENNIGKVAYEIVNNQLIISDERKLKFTKPNQHIYLKLYAPEFFRFNLNGGVTLTNKIPLTSTEIGVIFKNDYNFVDLTLNNDVFYFWNELDSGGEIKLNGTTNSVKFWFSGLVTINAKNALAKEVIIYSDSRVDTEVYASQNIDCEIVGEGNILLYGNPNIVVNHSDENPNSGKLIFKN